MKTDRQLLVEALSLIADIVACAESGPLGERAERFRALKTKAAEFTIEVQTGGANREGASVKYV
jgi:hypothetical protein